MKIYKVFKDNFDEEACGCALTCVYTDKKDFLIFYIEEERLTGVRHMATGSKRLSSRHVLEPIKRYYKHNPNLEIIELSEQPEKHHYYHLLSAYAQTKYDECVALISDGFDGERKYSVLLAHIKNWNVNIIKKFDINSSLGRMYAATSIAIFNHRGTATGLEGKVMGLAEYGKPLSKLKAFLYDETSLTIKKLSDIDEYASQFNCNQKNIFLNANVAATVQYHFEEETYKLCEWLANNYPNLPLIYSGGCALNATFNGKLLNSKLFPEVFIPPLCDDAGIIIGVLADELKIKFPPMIYNNMYDNNNLDLINYEKISYSEIAQLIKKGCIIAWFKDGSEYGPRALGHRSLLADASIKRNSYLLNEIKGREYWRPLAPIVLDSYYKNLFPRSTESFLHKVMLATEPIDKKYLSTYPVICSVANTARPQILYNDEFNFELYQMMNDYNLPVLVNTSFNGKGESIFEDLQNAEYFINKYEQIDIKLIVIINKEAYVYKRRNF